MPAKGEHAPKFDCPVCGKKFPVHNLNNHFKAKHPEEGLFYDRSTKTIIRKNNQTQPETQTPPPPQTPPPIQPPSPLQTPPSLQTQPPIVKKTQPQPPTPATPPSIKPKNKSEDDEFAYLYL